MQAYTKTHCIFEGRKSRVYLAGDGNGRDVVLKQLRKLYPDTSTVARFSREFEITRSAAGPNVIECYDLAVHDGTVSIALEDFGARSVADILKERSSPLPLEQVLRIGVQVAQALAHIHRRNIIHKDINPSNIVWNTGTGVVKLIDFGISQVLDRARVSASPLLDLQGTPAYISPEQTGRMNRDLDSRSDLYSLGVALYELLTGRLPFASEDPLELVHSHIARKPVPPSEVADIPARLSELVMTLLEKRAEDRYTSAEGVRHDLQACLDAVEAGKSPEAFPALRERDIDTRLRIPQKLYGREEESARLLATFDRVAEGGVGVLLVTGYSGVGKSSLVHEVHRPLTARRGITVEGKFDQLNRGRPYDSLVQAFRSLMKQLAAESEEHLNEWRDTLKNAVDRNGQVLIDVIPELEHIIGPQPPVERLGPAESRNRFQLLLSRFVRAIGTKEHPLVLFLDDMQWADLPTIELVNRLATDPETRYVLFLAAYRENEVDEGHALTSMITRMKAEGADLETVRLGPLQEPDVVELVGDTVRKAPGYLRLALTCHAKTRGNAFFLNRFLESLFDRGLLTFEPGEQRWEWDLKVIEAQSITDNVVEFMSAEIEELPPDSQAALQTASCVGISFDLATLAAARGVSEQQVTEELRKPLEEGLVRPLSVDFWYAPEVEGTSFSYGFAHDRVRQAAYAMLDEGQAAKLHLDLGRAMRSHSDPEYYRDHLFAIVEHLNRGAHLMEDDELAQLCRMNLEAGRRAAGSAAFEPGHVYYVKAHQYLPPDAWEKDYDLALEVHLEGARAAYLSGQYDVMEERLGRLKTEARDTLHQVEGQEVKIHALISQQKLPEAVYLALEVSKELGFPIPENPGPEEIQVTVGATLELLSGHTLESLEKLPEASDPRVVAALRVQNSIVAAAFLGVPNLFPVLCCKMVQTTLESGVTPHAVYAFSALGVVCISVNLVEEGYRIGKMSMSMLERWDDRSIEVKNLHVVGGMVNAYMEPLRTILENHRLVYRMGIETGDLEYAAWGLHVELANSVWSGLELDELAQTMDHHMAVLRHYKQMPALACSAPMVQLVRNLRGEAADPTRLVGPDYDEEAHLRELVEMNTRGAVFCVAASGTMARYLFGDPASAKELADRWAEYADGVQGTYQVIAWTQYRALATLRLCAAQSDQVPATLEDIAPQRELLKTLARTSPENFKHRVWLIEAEVARLEGRRGAAHEYYERCIRLARLNRFVQDEALANELAGRYLLENEAVSPARGYLQQAIFLYSYWGAQAKREQLEEEFTEILLPGARHRDATSSSTSGGDTISGSSEINLTVVVRASQAISKEIVLGDLVQSLLRLAVEAAGAQRGLLFLYQEKDWSVICEGVVRQEIELQLLDTPLASYMECPKKLLGYVRRTREEVVLSDASEKGVFTGDPYIKRRSSKSILCLPVKHQNEPKAILYLENELSPGAFSRQHLDLLRLLAAQAAISIENAQLYNTLERRVEERTEELQLEIKERIKAQEELRVLATTDSLTGASNRRNFLELAEKEFDRARRYPAPLSALMLDADKFKLVNDTYGHKVGDTVLKALSLTVSSGLRSTEIFGRMGGEEFAVALPSTGIDGAIIVAERLRKAVEALEVQADNEVLNFTVSIGVAEMTEDDASFEAILGRADQALYRAKEGGRNRVEAAQVKTKA
jgi:histidine kinase